MIQQANDGDIVAMIWPGKIGLVDKKISIKRQQKDSLMRHCMNAGHRSGMQSIISQ